jgi:hypothetical protein
MAILATLFGLLGRFTGKILTTSLGWASTLLFGRVPRDRQVFLAAITFGAVIWAVVVIGVVLPDVGAFLLAFIPIPPWVEETWVQLAMFAAALVIPPILGGATLFLLRSKDRPTGIPGTLVSLLRGYPLAAGLAVMLVFLAVIGIVRKASSLARRWTDAHIPIVVKPGGYDELVADLDTAISDAGVDVQSRSAPAVLVLPARVLAAIAGPHVQALLPHRLVRLVGKDVEVLIYPSDVSIAGKEVTVSRVQAALASRLTTARAWLTMTAEGQAIEDMLARLAAQRPGGADAKAALASIDQRLATDNLPYDEWEVLYRERLQVERDLLAGLRPGEAMPVSSGSSQAASRPPAGRSMFRRGRDAIWTAYGVATLTLLAIDVALLIQERVSTSRRSRRY